MRAVEIQNKQKNGYPKNTVAYRLFHEKSMYVPAIH